jgi:hypothetical protein
MSIKKSSLALLTISLLSACLSGCSVVTGIFRVGVWTGVIAVVLLVLLIGVVLRFLRKNGSS